MAAFVVNTTLIYKFLHVHIIKILLLLMLDIVPNLKFRKNPITNSGYRVKQ